VAGHNGQHNGWILSARHSLPLWALPGTITLSAGDIEIIREDKMSGKIILYDIASKLTPQAWSPNCWKAR
jgi:hypothetical protein